MKVDITFLLLCLMIGFVLGIEWTLYRVNEEEIVIYETFKVKDNYIYKLHEINFTPFWRSN